MHSEVRAGVPRALNGTKRMGRARMLVMRGR